MTEPNIEAKVRGKEILRMDSPFDIGLASLRSKGIKNPITSKELAFARTYHPEGMQSSLMQRGSHTNAGFVYFKGENPIRVADSPLLNAGLAKKATQANRENRYFVTESAEIYERIAKLAKDDIDKSPEKRKAIVLPSSTNFQISSAENQEVFENIFGNAGERYLKFLELDSLNVDLVDKGYVDSQKGTILTQEWLASLDAASTVDGYDRALDYDCTIRGVRLVRTGEASSKKTDKSVLPYTTKDIRGAEKEIDKLSKILQPNQFSNLQGLVSKLRGK